MDDNPDVTLWTSTMGKRRKGVPQAPTTTKDQLFYRRAGNRERVGVARLLKAECA